MATAELALADPELATTAITQEHQLGGSHITSGAPSVASTSLIEIYAFAANELLSGTPSVGDTVIGQAHALLSANITSGAPSIPTLIYDAGIPRAVDFAERSNNVVTLDDLANEFALAS